MNVDLKVAFIIILNIFMFATLLGFDDGMEDLENLNKEIYANKARLEVQQFIK